MYVEVQLANDSSLYTGKEFIREGQIHNLHGLGGEGGQKTVYTVKVLGGGWCQGVLAPLIHPWCWMYCRGGGRTLKVGEDRHLE